MKILIVDNHDSFIYNLAQMVEQSHCGNITIVKNNAPKFDASAFDKIIFSPGPSIPLEEAGLMKSILQQHNSSKSIIGICLGHQAIGEYYGATLSHLPHPLHGIKARINILDHSCNLFEGLPERFYGGLYHSWYISNENFPDNLSKTAISDSGIIMAISHKQYNVKGLQFHPESIMTDNGATIIRNWLKH